MAATCRKTPGLRAHGRGGDSRSRADEVAAPLTIPANPQFCEARRTLDEHFDVAVIGAGLTGLYSVYRLNQLGLGVRSYEEGEGVGGTWYWNRYPGCRFDTYSPVYSYSFSEELLQEWDWHETYSPQPHNERYMNHVADKFDLRRHVELSTRVVSVVFDEKRSRWTIALADGRRSTAQFVVSAVGKLSSRYVPDLPGLNDFKGIWVHTGRWPKQGIDLEGKRVAVIGTGATGVQVVPEVARIASRLVVFQRTAQYCIRLGNRPIAPDEMRRIKAGYRELFHAMNTTGRPPFDLRPVNEYTQGERRAIYEKVWNESGRWGLATLWPECLEVGPINDELSDWIKDQIRARVKDPAVAEKLVPNDHKYGERREPGEDGYYEAFNRDNVELVDAREDPIERLTPTGLKTRHNQFEFDVIIFATGWDVVTGPLFAIDTRGIAGITLKSKLASGIRAYWHLMSADFPNFYMLGPATAGITSRSTEPLVDWVAEQICEVRRRGAKQVVPTAEAENAWVRYTEENSGKHRFWRSNGSFVGGNIPGKPRGMLSPLFEGELNMRKRRAASAATGYPGFELR